MIAMESLTNLSLRLGDGWRVEAIGAGIVHMEMIFQLNELKAAALTNALYVPRLSCNLFSVQSAVKTGNTVKFGLTKCWIRCRDGKLRGMGKIV